MIFLSCWWLVLLLFWLGPKDSPAAGFHICLGEEIVEPNLVLAPCLGVARSCRLKFGGLVAHVRTSFSEYQLACQGESGAGLHP
jgi:hypothetical protein